MLFEKNYNEEMNISEIKEAYSIYTKFKKNHLDTECFINIYVKCTSLLDINRGDFMMWQGITFLTFVEKYRQL